MIQNIKSKVGCFLISPVYKTKFFFTKIHRIQTSKRINIQFPHKIIYQKNLSSAIEDSVNNDFWGVQVLSSPYGTGKSTCTSLILNKYLMQKKIRLLSCSIENLINKNGFVNSLLEINSPFGYSPNIPLEDWNKLITDCKKRIT